MAEKIYHYPLWIRIWHMCNALLCLTLIVTGVSMQFSEPDLTLVRFDLAVTVHNAAAILLSLNYVFFLVANKISGNIRFYRIPKDKPIGLMLQQFRYYSLGIFKGEKPPFPVSQERKFNPLQQIAYVVVVYVFLPLIIISGMGLLFPEIVIFRFFNVGGLFLTDLLHILIGFGITLFLVVHVYFCTMGVTLTSLFKGMINGWVEAH